MNTINLLLISEHPLIMLGLRALLTRRPGLRVVAECISLNDGLAAAQRVHPDAVIIDIDSEHADGLEVCAQLAHLDGHPYVIVLTDSTREDVFQRACRSGATGFCLKQSHSEDLVRQLRLTREGHGLSETRTQETILAELRRLSRAADPSAFALLSHQERRVLLLVAEGKTNHEIASELHLGEGTVRNYISSILEKLGCANRAEAAAFAVAHRLEDAV